MISQTEKPASEFEWRGVDHSTEQSTNGVVQVIHGPNIKNHVVLPDSLIHRVRHAMQDSIRRHRVSPAPESRKLGEALEEVYLQLGEALSRFADKRELWGDGLEPGQEVK